MAIMRMREETILRVYRCPVCNDVFDAQVGTELISCAVNHAPGSCCHYAENVVTDSQLLKLREALK